MNARQAATLRRIVLRRFGSQLRHQRKRAGLTQAALADLISHVRTSVVNMEAGRQDPTIATLARLAVALHCTPRTLVS